MTLLQQVHETLGGTRRREPMVDRRQDQERRERFDDVILGRPCPFWPTSAWREIGDRPRYDAEQEIELFAAVQHACSLPGATPAQRWAVVERTLRELAFDYSEEARV